ncbi:MAG: Omp28-related outer membrane protein [Crocinitomicaceae bacterium]
MKKNLLSIIGITASFSLFAQLPVSTMQENKNVILEEFTGIYCGFCPQGHAIGNTLAANNPGDVVLINIHAGGYANPNGADPDFRTPFGAAIDGQSSLAGYPAGTVNRHQFVGLEQNTNAPGTAMGRGNWGTAATQVLAEPSYVNVATEGTIDFVTRLLTVNVEAHFTGAAPGSMMMNVALLQDNIEGPQSGSAGNASAVLPNGNYNHTHMLRHLLTGQWGDPVTTTTQGTTWSQTYTYTIPDDLNGIDYVMGNFEIVAFIAEGQQEIVTGASGPIVYSNVPNDNATAISAVGPPAICELSAGLLVKVRNNGGNDITSLDFSYDAVGQNTSTYNWTGNIPSFGEGEVMLPAIAVPNGGGVMNATITMVNGGTDADPSDNSTTSAPLAISSTEATGTVYDFNFTQDRYGSETTWEIIDESAGTIMASGGPYQDLAANGVLLHASQVTLPATGCYVIKVYDSYGDGINSGAGSGNYTLKNQGNDLILFSSGTFTDQEWKPFDVVSLTPIGLGIDESSNVSELEIYPNPVTNMANIQFNLNDANNATLTVRNILGEVIYTQNDLTQGANIINLDVTNFAGGMYFATIKSESASTATKFTVAK